MSVFICKLCALHWASLFLWCRQWKFLLLCLNSSASHNLSRLQTTPLSSRFYTSFPISISYGKLVCFSEYLAKLSCPAPRWSVWPLMQLCVDTWLLIELPALMFMPSSVVLIYPHGNNLDVVKPLSWYGIRPSVLWVVRKSSKLQIGHVCLTHGHLLCGELAPLCIECGVPPIMSHMLVECSFYGEACLLFGIMVCYSASLEIIPVAFVMFLNF